MKKNLRILLKRELLLCTPISSNYHLIELQLYLFIIITTDITFDSALANFIIHIDNYLY